ncbi:hypothetical protein HP550_04450 [Cellulomonas humilata]|uniref:Uncharacterized protein n=1 Tax=Cellulomonas humilata TaxID=144055 RepID=A0A7Y6DWP0_9CELL|nr:hypothetical protein [Cellulomonas humilata]NUU16495.1 hypothetical protein [Cellulomonas humilata]
MSVRGPKAIAALCLRCLAVLSLVNGAAVTVFLLTDADSPWARQAPQTLYYLVVALVVAAVLIGLVGFPAGVLIARLLEKSRREWVHVAAFALGGAVLSVTLFAMFGILQSGEGWYTLIAAAEGALGAGVARWRTGRVHARQTPWTQEQGAALPWGKITP